MSEQHPAAGPAPSTAVNLQEKFALFDELWTPYIVGELNGQHVKIVKLEGAFVWHQHEAEDELFLVVAGEMRMEFRDRQETLGPGEFIIVPRGVEHRPVATTTPCQVLLFEPSGTLNTGDQLSNLTHRNPSIL